MGAVQSFSASSDVATKFYEAEATGRGRGYLYQVDTRSAGEFITAPRLLLTYADFLVEKGLVTVTEVRAALGWALAAKEHEIFYVLETPVPGSFVGAKPIYETLSSIDDGGNPLKPRDGR